MCGMSPIKSNNFVARKVQNFHLLTEDDFLFNKTFFKVTWSMWGLWYQLQNSGSQALKTGNWFRVFFYFWRQRRGECWADHRGVACRLGYLFYWWPGRSYWTKCGSGTALSLHSECPSPLGWKRVNVNSLFLCSKSLFFSFCLKHFWAYSGFLHCLLHQSCPVSPVSQLQREKHTKPLQGSKKYKRLGKP